MADRSLARLARRPAAVPPGRRSTPVSRTSRSTRRRTLYVGTNGGGVFRSTTGGGSWVKSNAGLGNLTIRTLALDPKTPTTIYAGTLAGVFKSTTSAGAWSTSSAGMP